MPKRSTGKRAAPRAATDAAALKRVARSHNLTDEQDRQIVIVQGRSNLPYKLETVNTGTVKHYFTAEAFYGSVAFLKA